MKKLLLRKSILFVIAVAAVLVGALALRRPRPIPVNEVPPTGGVTEVPQQVDEGQGQEPPPDRPLDLSGCFRPYTVDSIWNVPLDWTRAKIHPDNAAMINAFLGQSHWIGSDTGQYAPNIYFVSNDTPVVAVKLRKNSYRDASNDVNIEYGQPGGTVWMPIPQGAVPAPGTDGQMAVINLDTGEEWGINQGEVDSEGHWTVGGAYRYSIYNSGIPPQGFAQRGAGIGQVAGIIRPCEVERGSINHAVTLAYNYPCAPEGCLLNGRPAFIPPFTKTDGKGQDAYDIPEGARIAIRPEIAMDQIREVCNGIKGCEVWARNMQVYGGFIVDDSGHPKTYAQGNATAHWDPTVWTADMLRDIPSNWYVVIDWNFPSTKAP
jgi:hypothetical protein